MITEHHCDQYNTTEHHCDQYSEKWTRLRLGKPTASGFADIITPLTIHAQSHSPAR
jgi:hypothetical protein